MSLPASVVGAKPLNVSRATITNLINQAYDPSSIAANNLSEILLRLQAAKEIAEVERGKENNRIYQLKIKEAARAAREEAKKVRDEAKAVKAAELDAKRRDRDAAKAIQQPQSGKRKASSPLQSNSQKRRVGGAGGGTLAEVAAPAPPPTTTRRGRAVNTPAKYR
ncbi:hypothetical protein A1F94_007257 [Pyrenophora tritici-repentis]|nr:hypothetical protein A1F94_007257 [Pyrenophora tritici-repentis]